MRKLSSRLGRLLRTTGLAIAIAWPAYADSQFEIIRDTWGVPHIYAEDTFGLFAGYGYAVAQDRLFQMEMARRAVRGEVAAVLGIEHLPFDMGSRAAFDQADIQRQIDALPPEQRDILRGYAAGINAGIRAAEADPDALMPKQFGDFGFAPSPGPSWTWR